MKQVLLIGFFMALSARAADTDVGVMAPLGASADEAAKLTAELRTTLTLRSMSVTDPVLLARFIAIGCEQQSDDCLVDVAREVATRNLVRTRVTKTPAGYTIDLALLDARTGAITRAPPLTTGDFNTALNGARTRLLELLQPGSQKGVIVVKVRGEGVTVSVDGVSSKIGEPISLGIGPHTLDIAAPGKTPASRSVNVEADGAVEVAFCVDVDAVVEGDACAEVGPPLPVLTIAGGATAGVGAVVLGLGGLVAGLSANARDAYRDSYDKTTGLASGDPAEAAGLATAATGLLVAGGVIGVIGVGMLVAGFATEGT